MNSHFLIYIAIFIILVLAIVIAINYFFKLPEENSLTLKNCIS